MNGPQGARVRTAIASTGLAMGTSVVFHATRKEAMMRAVMLPALLCGPLLVLVSASGCDAENPASGPTGPTDAGTGSATPPQQCNQVLDLLCQRLVDCDESTVPANAAADRAACRQELAVVLPCDRAISAAATVPQCVSDLGVISCASLFTAQGASLPGSCQSLFDFMASPAEQQCIALAEIICKRILECDDTIVTLTQAECVDATTSSLDCSFVTGVSATYEMCMMDLTNQTCGVLFPPPLLELDLPQACFEVLE